MYLSGKKKEITFSDSEIIRNSLAGEVDSIDFNPSQ